MTPPRLAIVLHTHMPYVEGFGTWPFGEEWLWEAIATSYVPLVRALDERPGRVTVSATPVLLDQLEAPGALDRCLTFLREVRPASHDLDMAEERDPAIRAQLERSAADYASAADDLALVERLREHTTWTSSATHAILPLLATAAGIRLQVRTGIAAHRARHGDWGGGFWLPECAHAPWIDGLLEEAGVRVTCVDWTDRGPEHQQPVRSPAGPVLVPIDREIVELVWSPEGYPCDGAYMDTHWVTARRHRVRSIDGRPYDAERAAAKVREHAEDFVARVRTRAGLCVCALDTELLGHWWPEGVDWLAAVLDVAEREGLEVVPLEPELVAGAPAMTAEPPVTSWGTPRDLSTWSAPAAGGLAWRQRRAELRVLAGELADQAAVRALRELLALQSSDWAFLITRDTAGPYPRERADAHESALERALAGEETAPELRNLAPFLQPAAFREP